MGIALSPKQSLPRVGKVASEASRIGFWRYERQAGKIVSSAPFARAPYPPLRGPPSPMGKAIKLSGRTFLAPHRGSCPKG